MPNPPPPHITDYMRILLGNVPWSFLVESAIRLVAMYLVLLTGLRLMGKRMAGQFSRTELAALVSLAAAVGTPLLAPDRGILDSVVIALVVVGIQRLVVHWAARHPRVEQALQGNLTTVVKDGVLQLANMEQAVLSQERLFAQLRGGSLDHLGQVRRLYMEANGKFSLVEEEKPAPGLSLIPGWDQGFRQVQPVAAGTFACRKCGQTVEAPQVPATPCPHCHARQWEPAVTAIEVKKAA